MKLSLRVAGAIAFLGAIALFFREVQLWGRYAIGTIPVWQIMLIGVPIIVAFIGLALWEEADKRSKLSREEQFRQAVQFGRTRRSTRKWR